MIRDTTRGLNQYGSGHAQSVETHFLNVPEKRRPCCEIESSSRSDESLIDCLEILSSFE